MVLLDLDRLSQRTAKWTQRLTYQQFAVSNRIDEFKQNDLTHPLSDFEDVVVDSNIYRVSN
jgi:hypothetical protein